MKGKIFNAQEVQAILNGSKVMFREVIKPQPKNTEYCGKNSLGAFVFHEKEMRDYVELIHPPYQVGQKIFCKEVFGEDWFNDICYKATDQADYAVSSWKPAQHMKQEHSRLTLLIKEIRVERLGDISADDCWKEGIAYSPECCQNYIAIPDCNGNPTPSCCNNPNVVHPQPQFEQIWNATCKKPEEKFEASPWVWSILFEAVK